MQEQKRYPTLEEMREQFRRDHPELKLPPARKETPEERAAREEEFIRREEIRLKHQAINQEATKKPGRILQAISRILDVKR
jgi:hypothetical protein